MEAGRSLRELFAELSRTGADPAELLHAAGYGDVPEPLVAEAIVSYAGTAPLEVAEHLAPFAVAHGPVPDPGAAPVGAHSGLSLLASAPPVDAPEPVGPHAVPDDLDSDHIGDPGHLADHLDVDPSALDDPAVHPGADPPVHPGADPPVHPGADHVPPHHGDVDPAGLDSGPPHGPVEPHLAHGSFGAGHDGEPPADDGRLDGHADDTAAADHHVDAFLDHADDVDVHAHDVSDHDPSVTGAEPAEPLLDHDDHPDPADLLDVDDHHLP